MPIDPLLGLGVYIICWWVCLFVMLPIGVRGVHEDGAAPSGHERGAPIAPNLGKKALWTTGLAFLVWLLIIALIALDPTGIREAGFASGEGRR